MHPISLPVCKHCGSPVPSGRSDGFCCAGCVYVHDLLHREGLAHFYDLKGSQSLPPVSPQSLRDRDYEWLEILVREAEQLSPGNPAAECTLILQGLSCIGCVWLIDKIFSRHSGGLRVNVDVVQGEVWLLWQKSTLDVIALARDLQSFGYLVGPPQEGMEGKKQASGMERRMGVCGAFAMNAMAFSLPRYFGMPLDFSFAHWFDIITAVSATLSLLVGGSYFIEKAWRSLRAGALHIDTPIALGILAAYAGSMAGWILGIDDLKYFDFVAIFIFLMLVGRWAQQAAVERNRRKLMRDTSVPDAVRLVAADDTVSVHPLKALKPGMRFLVKPAQSVPVAARLVSTRASVSLEWINGESESQQRAAGQMLSSGALNIGRQELEMEALETWQDSTLRKLLDARRPGEFRDLGLERLLRWYLACVLLTGLVGGLVWLSQGAPFGQALQVMISIFVVSCPCALGVAIPLAEELAATRAERLGVFVRTFALWKRLMRVQRVAFDKTGTLTLENPVLENPSCLTSLSDEARRALRTLVTGNLHPVSRSLFDEIGPGKGLAGEITECVGQGMQCIDEAGRRWELGRSTTGHADAQFSCDGTVLAAFLFSDRLRPQSVEEVLRLQQRGIQVHILSGDRPDKVAAIAAQLALPPAQWQGGMTPEQKAEWVHSHNECNLLFIGDGANDSLAFDAALVAGSPVTGRSFLEQKADFFFLGHTLHFVTGLLDIARRHRRATRRVFAFSVLYNIATIIAGLLGHLSPVAAAVLMPLSSLVTLGIVAATFGKRRQPMAQPVGANPPQSSNTFSHKAMGGAPA